MPSQDLLGRWGNVRIDAVCVVYTCRRLIDLLNDCRYLEWEIDRFQSSMISVVLKAGFLSYEVSQEHSHSTFISHTLFSLGSFALDLTELCVVAAQHRFRPYCQPRDSAI